MSASPDAITSDRLGAPNAVPARADSTSSAGRIPETVPAGFTHLIAWLFLGLGVLGLWAGLSWKLSIDWSTNAQYEFGYIAPPCIAYLLWDRWRDRPAPGAPDTLAFAGIFPLLLLLLPLRIILESNPDWRPLNWVNAGVVVALTAGFAAAFGGRSWMRHFLPPLLLVFFVIPWPLAIEQASIQSLSRIAAAIATELLNLFGYTAVQKGNSIQTEAGLLGVSDACSGIRSVAGLSAAAVFLGEFKRFRAFRRLWFVGFALLLALALNVGRVFTLCAVRTSEGESGFISWHDPAGYVTFAIGLVLLWLLAERLGGHPGPASAVPSPTLTAPLTSLAIVLPLWLLSVEGVNRWWFQSAERHTRSGPSWELHPPEHDPAWKPTVLSEEAASILRYSHGKSAVYSEIGAPLWQIFFFEWDPGRTSAQLARMHRPEICLPAAGIRHVGSAPPFTLAAAGTTLEFEGSVFDSQNGVLYVYRTLSEQRPDTARANAFDLGVKGRLLGAWAGVRNTGQKLLQICVVDAHDEFEARQDIQDRLPPLLRSVEN